MTIFVVTKKEIKMFSNKLERRVKELEKKVEFLEKLKSLQSERLYAIQENQGKLIGLNKLLAENLETLQKRYSHI
jgi:hypothetical protein